MGSSHDDIVGWYSQAMGCAAGTAAAILDHSGYIEVSSVFISPDDTVVALVSLDGTAKLWDAQSGHGLYSSDGSAVALVSQDGAVKILTGHTPEDRQRCTSRRTG